jgi:hypothetical protein
LLGLALVASCAQTLATSGQVTVTAESVCALRAVAAKHPDPKVRNPDYLAGKFVSDTEVLNEERLQRLRQRYSCRAIG